MLQGYYIFFIAFLMGLKHALEPDHLVAVSTIVYKHKNPFKAAYNGFVWGIGHTFTIFIIGFFVLTYKLSISENLADWLEHGVAVMIIFLGLKTLLNYKETHSHSHDHHTHTHDHTHDHSHSHDHHHHSKDGVDTIKSLVVGTIQGLAGSAALVILAMTTVNNTFQGLLFILIFGAGTIVAMFLYTYMVSYSINLSNTNNLQLKLNILVGVLSTTFGTYYLISL